MTPPRDQQREYPWRRYGMDHDRYEWSIMPRRRPVEWPNGARLAVWVIAPLTWFPLAMSRLPRPPTGAFDDPFPNFRDYTHRDYGNRVGAFRVMETLDRFGVPATAPVNAAVCERYPALVEEALRHRWEFAGHGLNMARIHDTEMSEADEAHAIATTLSTVRRVTGQPVTGWLSPGNGESPRTLDLLASAGIQYVCDWVNDELPYPVQTDHGRIHAMPYSYDINDATMIWASHHSPTEFTRQVADQFDWLYDESRTRGGRIFTLVLHSWCIGQPHRIRALDRILEGIANRPGVWMGTGAQILDCFRAQQDRAAGSR
jgi:peptidoglycan/xylan/chitin deacetylase (PgdA/CDA1 family)